jgi:endonuclease/exonuclease/phosphatase family metal-dependent hydrolase
MRRSGFILALVVCLGPVMPAAPRVGITIMSYNVQNLFDGERNGTEYKEFDPGKGKWTGESFLLRVQSISEVVRKAVAGGPDILLLQEVENENALRVLADKGLKGMGYTALVLVPRKGLAATTAIVSRLPVTRVRTHAVVPWRKETPVRDIMEAEITAAGHTLYVLNNHWKSKTEGVKATEESRRDSAAVLARRMREITARDPAADVIAAGDMNESADEYVRIGRAYRTALLPEALAGQAGEGEIVLSSVPREAAAWGKGCVLYDPWLDSDVRDKGSYSYQGEWLTIDHILLSPGLFDRSGFTYRQGSFSVIRLPFLLTPGGTPRGWNGLMGDRGYSDHLPILLTLGLEK